MKSEQAKESPEDHAIYRFIRDKNFAAEHLSWPSYIILRALYRDLPQAYVGHIERKFGTAAIKDFSDAFFKHYPQEGVLTTAMAESLGPEVATKAGVMLLAPATDLIQSEQGVLKLWLDAYKAIKDKNGVEDDDSPAPKRQKRSHESERQNASTTAQQKPEATAEGQVSKNVPKNGLACAKEAPQIQNATAESSSVITPEATSPINLDICDVQGQLLSKTSQKESQGEDNAASGVPKQSQVEQSESRLKALEESHRVLVSKIDTTAAALDVMNTTIETIITEVRADRERYNHFLSGIKDVMMGLLKTLRKR